MQLRILSIIFALIISPAIASAQPAPAGATPGTGHSSGSSFDPARMKRMTLDLIRDKTAATDEEWKTLLPKIEKVMDAQKKTRTGAGMSFSSPGMTSRNGVATITSAIAGGGTNVDTPAGQAMQKVRAALEKQTPDDDIRKKLAALREARDQARADLAAAQKELKEACSARQEAALVTLGQLE
jgi:hypothetical protein